MHEQKYCHRTIVVLSSLPFLSGGVFLLRDCRACVRANLIDGLLSDDF